MSEIAHGARIGMLVRGNSYAYINSKAVPIGFSLNPKGFWVHIMGPDFEEENGVFALYSESGKYIGGSPEKLLDINPAAIYKEPEKPAEEEFNIDAAPVEEVFEI